MYSHEQTRNDGQVAQFYSFHITDNTNKSLNSFCRRHADSLGKTSCSLHRHALLGRQ
jgi:hypothetical protein